MALISLDNVSKIYPKGTRPALDDINLDIERGDFVFLVGASGSGKTTLLSLLLREEEATNGEIRGAGNDLRRITNRQVPQYRRSLGFVFQCIGMGVNNFIRTAGAPNRALGTMIIGAVSCTVFNFLFVMVLGWGVQGSALATVCGQAISCATVLWYFIVTKNVPMKLHLHYLPLHLRTVRLILSLGLASFAVQAGMAVVNFVLNNLLNMLKIL